MNKYGIGFITINDKINVYYIRVNINMTSSLLKHLDVFEKKFCLKLDYKCNFNETKLMINFNTTDRNTWEEYKQVYHTFMYLVNLDLLNVKYKSKINLK